MQIIREFLVLQLNLPKPSHHRGGHIRRSHWGWQIWGRIPTSEEVQKEVEFAQSQGVPPQRTCFCNTNRKYDFYTKRNRKRDKSGWRRHWRCSGQDKRIGNRHLRAKQKNALVNGKYDIIPHLRKYDSWMYW